MIRVLLALANGASLVLLPNPIGPIVINLAQPVLTDDQDQTEKLQFSFGTQF